MTTNPYASPSTDSVNPPPQSIERWTERHQLPFNFWIHMIGIPLGYGGLVMLFFLPWYCGIGTAVIGFGLQWIGHRAEGNDVGEWAAIKRLLGLPYVGVSPRWKSEDRHRS